MSEGLIVAMRKLVQEYESKKTFREECSFSRSWRQIAKAEGVYEKSPTGIVSQVKRILDEYGSDKKACVEALEKLHSEWVNEGFDKHTVFHCLVCRADYPDQDEVSLVLEEGSEICNSCFMKMSEYERARLVLWEKTFNHYNSELLKTLHEIKKSLEEIWGVIEQLPASFPE